MRRLTVLTLVLLMAAQAAIAKRQRTVIPTANLLSIEFETSAGSGTLDLGAISAASQRRGRRGESFTLQRRVGVRVRGNETSAGTATVMAYVALPTEVRFYLDGVLLTQTPRIIDTRAPLNRTVDHTLEIEIPKSKDQGTLDSGIEWEVISN
jgi:hypothetical protein